MNTKISKIAEEIGIPVDYAERMVLREHELTHLYEKDELVSIEINVNDEVQKYLDKVTSALKVSSDAVIFTSIMNCVEEEKK